MNALYNIFAVPGFGEIALVAAMIFISVLLLGLLVWSRWHWSIKASATLIMGLFFALTYFSIIEMQGWPTKAEIPEKFHLIWYYVDSPNKQINKKGFIVIWALELNQKIGKKPRSYILEYNLEMHRRLQKAREQMLRGGSRMMGKRVKRKQIRSPDSTYKHSFKFYKMPPPNPPRKQ